MCTEHYYSFFLTLSFSCITIVPSLFLRALFSWRCPSLTSVSRSRIFLLRRHSFCLLSSLLAIATLDSKAIKLALEYAKQTSSCARRPLGKFADPCSSTYTATDSSSESKQAQRTSHSPLQVAQPFETSTRPHSTPEGDPTDRQHAVLAMTTTSTPRFSTSMEIASRFCTAVRQISETMGL